MKQLWRILREYDTESAELGLGLLLLAWALVLSNPYVRTFASSPSFHIMAAVAPEEVWAVVMAVVGLIKLWGLLAAKLWARRFGALLGTCIWVAIALCIGAANPAGTGIVVYPAFALGSVWVLWRLFREPVRQ